MWWWVLIVGGTMLVLGLVLWLMLQRLYGVTLFLRAPKVDPGIDHPR